MSEDFKNSFFFLLPNEILIRIFDLIKTSDVLNFCAAYDCDYFLQERNVIKTVDIAKSYDLCNLASILKRINLNHVTTFNMNCVYWIEAKEILEIVSSMVNLQTFYAIHTQFGLTIEDTEVLSKSKIRKLGISVNNEYNRSFLHTIPSVLTLYICAYKPFSKIFKRRRINEIFPNLNKLWVENNEARAIDEIKCCISKATNKFFCQGYASGTSRYANFENLGLTTYFKNESFDQITSMCCEKLSDTERNSETSLDSWKVLDEFKYPKPYNPKDARKLFLKETTLNDIFFEELNFDRLGRYCLSFKDLQEPIKEILKSPSTSKLKRLSIPICLFKMENGCSHDFEHMFSNFSGLQHLEIYDCGRNACVLGANRGFPLISMLANLHTLVIQVSDNSDVNFLSEVLNKCHLKVLKILCRSSKTLHTVMCQNISKAEYLVDFTYDYDFVPLNPLLENLCLIKTRNLQRVAILSHKSNNDKFDASLINEFLKINPQLVFFYLRYNFDSSQLQFILDTFNFYEKKHPCKRFLLEAHYDLVPETHNEMLSGHFRSKLAGLSPLDNFLTF